MPVVNLQTSWTERSTAASSVAAPTDLYFSFPPTIMSSMMPLMDSKAVADALHRISSQITASVAADMPLTVIGVRSRGEILARRLAALLAREGREAVELGALDITLYRDDLHRSPAAHVKLTDIPFSLDEKLVILVDDVLYTGRSIRAALDALVDFGRPRVIRLAVLIDREGRELPIQPDFVGLERPVPLGKRVQLHLKETDGEDEVLIVDE